MGTTQRQSRVNPGATSPHTDDDVFDPFSEIITLARGGTSRSRFHGDVLRCITRFFRSPYAALHLRYAAEVIQDDCHVGSTDPKFWKSSLQQFLTESLAEARSRAKVLKSKAGNTRVALLSAPMFDPSGPAIGALALIVTPIEEADVATCLARLESLARVASLSAEFVGAVRGADAVTGASIQAQAHAARCGTTTELAFAITNELRNKLGGEQVSLGLVRRNRVTIASISGLDDVKKQSPGVVSLLGAMEECLDAGGPIVYQREGGWSFDGKSAGYRLHKQWHTAASGDAVASIPLRVDDETVAVLSIRQRADRPFTEEQVEQIRSKVEPLAPALILTQHANRSLTRHMADSVHGMIDALTTPGKVGRRIAVGMIAVGLVWFTFGTMNYELAVPAVVTAAEIRHISSPFDGVLTAAHAVEGDRVSRGDVLCEFDRRDLEQERTQLLAELALQERIMDRARAQESPYEVQLGLAQQAVVNAKLAMVDRRIEQATITAPIDGVIVVGDLRKWISSVVAQGDPLFQVAPMDRWTLELQVPEASSAELSPDLAGSFATYARPQDVRRFRISRVLAAAQARDTRNVYIAEADVDARNDWIRPGMEGIARIQLGPKPVWWIAFHRVIDYLRIHLWL